MNEQEPKTEHHAATVPYNTQPAGLEKWMDDTFNKKSPVQLPAGAKNWFGDNLWWLAIVGAVMSLLGAWSTWQTVNSANRMLDAFGVGDMYRQEIGGYVYVSIAASLVSAALLLMAQAKLKERRKDGWNLLFYSFLLGLALSLVSMVMNAAYGVVGGIIGLAIGFVIGGWLLFQIRSQFNR